MLFLLITAFATLSLQACTNENVSKVAQESIEFPQWITYILDNKTQLECKSCNVICNGRKSMKEHVETQHPQPKLRYSTESVAKVPGTITHSILNLRKTL